MPCLAFLMSRCSFQSGILIAFSLASTASLFSAIVRVEVPGGATKDLTISQSAEPDLRFRWNLVCTQDIPTSACGYSLRVFMTDGIEVLFQPDDLNPQSLAPGELLGEDSPGEWRTNRFGIEHSIASWSRTGGTHIHWNDIATSHLAGFRVPTENGLYYYGWIDLPLARNAESFPPSQESAFTVHYSDQPTNSLLIPPIPEPSGVAFAILFGSSILWQRRRSQGGFEKPRGTG